MSNRKTVLTEKQKGRILEELRHLDPDTIQAYAQEKITDPTELERIEAHLFDCEECLTEFNAAFDVHSPRKADFDAFHAKSTIAPTHQQKMRLIASLERLASAYEGWKKRLLDWRDLLRAQEARYGVSLTAKILPDSEDNYVKVLRALSMPTIDVAQAGFKGVSGEEEHDPDAASEIVITAEDRLTVFVKVEEDSVILNFINWSENVAPLAVLLPEDNDSEGLLPDRIESPEPGEFALRFERVPSGSYVLSIAPLQ